MSRSWLAVLPVFVLSQSFAGLFCSTKTLADTAGGSETLIFLRHGEKPEQGLGQLNCQGLNRALALPAVLEAKFGRPAVIFAPNPSIEKEDAGTPYDYVRPLATIEPSAVRFGLPVETAYGFADIAGLKTALEAPAYRSATVVVAWEHKLLVVLVKNILAAHGGNADAVPKWKSDDFDGLYIVRIAWGAPGQTATFEQARQGLDGQPAQCPK